MVNTKKKIDLNSPVFDYDDFLDRIDGDVDLMKEVIEIFLEDAPGLLSNLYDGIHRRDFESVERAAHTLKGATANISAKRLQQLAQHVQWELKENNVAYLDSFIHHFEENYKQLKSVLQEYLHK